MRPSTTSAPSHRTRWMLLLLVSVLAVLAFTAACSPGLFDGQSHGAGRDAGRAAT